MPYSYQTVTTDGASAVVLVPFPFLEREHVSITLDGLTVSPANYTWITDGEVHLTTVPAAGKARTVKRTTPADEPAVIFQAGNLTSANINISILQQLYVAQESFDTGENVRDIAETVLAAIQGIDEALTAVQSAKDATLAASAEVAASRIVVQQLRDEVQAIIDLNALGVGITAISGLTATNVQDALAQLMAKITALTTRVTDLETLTANLPATLNLKYDKAGGTILGNVLAQGTIKTTGAYLEVENAAPTVWITRTSGRKVGWTVDSGGNTVLVDSVNGTLFYVTSGGAVYCSQMGDLSTRIENRAAAYAAGALSTANANIANGDNSRVSAVALGGSWSGGRPAGGVMTGLAGGGDSGVSSVGKYLYYYIPAAGWVLAGDIS